MRNGRGIGCFIENEEGVSITVNQTETTENTKIRLKKMFNLARS
jgi:hypothetical protein